MLNQRESWRAKRSTPLEFGRGLQGILDKTRPVRATVVKVWGVPGDSRCRMCWETDETIEHLLHDCKALSFTCHLKRHDAIFQNVLYAITRSAGVHKQFKRHWWAGHPKSVIPLSDSPTEHYVRWNPRQKTLDSIEHNHPDMIVNYPRANFLLWKLQYAETIWSRSEVIRKLGNTNNWPTTWPGPIKRDPMSWSVGTIGVVSKETVKTAEKLNSWGAPLDI